MFCLKAMGSHASRLLVRRGGGVQAQQRNQYTVSVDSDSDSGDEDSEGAGTTAHDRLGGDYTNIGDVSVGFSLLEFHSFIHKLMNGCGLV